MCCQGDCQELSEERGGWRPRQQRAPQLPCTEHASARLRRALQLVHSRSMNCLATSRACERTHHQACLRHALRALEGTAMKPDALTCAAKPRAGARVLGPSCPARGALLSRLGAAGRSDRRGRRLEGRGAARLAALGAVPPPHASLACRCALVRRPRPTTTACFGKLPTQQAKTREHGTGPHRVPAWAPSAAAGGTTGAARRTQRGSEEHPYVPGGAHTGAHSLRDPTCLPSHLAAALTRAPG